MSEAGATTARRRILVLGPDPRNGSISTCNYCRDLSGAACRELGRRRNFEIVGMFPGGSESGSECPQSVWGGVRRRVDNFVLWPGILRGCEGELFHIVDQGIAWYGHFLRRGPTIITVHDLINFQSMRGEFQLYGGRAWSRWLVGQNVRAIGNARHVIAISECTRRKVLEYTNVPPDRVSVIHNCVRPEFRVLSDEERARLREKMRRGAEAAVLHVGKDTPYKNRVGVIKGFAEMRRTVDSVLHLVPGACREETLRVIEQYRLGESIVFHDDVGLSELVSLYNGADVFVFPSIYEGFGVPVVEAMACGCPVVASEGGSLSEVAKNCCGVVRDPRAEKEIGAALLGVLGDSVRRAELTALGLDRAEEFSQMKTLTKVIGLYEGLI